MSTDHTRDVEQELDRFWDALVRGEGIPVSPTLDVAMTDHVRRLHELAHAPTPAGARERVRRGLFEPIVPHLNGKEPPMSQAIAFPVPRPVLVPTDRSAPSDVRTRRPSPLGSTPALRITAALLLVIALAASYLAFGPGRSEPTNRPPALPAAFAAPATATPAPDGSMLTVTFPAEVFVPGMAYNGAGLAHFSLPVGVHSTWTPGGGTGPLIEYVLTGTYTVRAQAEVRVVRAGGASEQIPANVEVTLGPGDALILRNEIATENANTGTVPVNLLSWVLLNDPSQSYGGHSALGWGSGAADVQGPLDVPTGPATVKLVKGSLDDKSAPLPAGTFRFSIPAPPLATGAASATPVIYYPYYTLTVEWASAAATATP